uniref:Uncharacterized protein n=1 Tax=Oryza rufipogon TaxID=4529 RepID=A0A0E0PEH2_ORYRU
MVYGNDRVGCSTKNTRGDPHEEQIEGCAANPYRDVVLLLAEPSALPPSTSRHPLVVVLSASASLPNFVAFFFGIKVDSVAHC